MRRLDLSPLYKSSIGFDHLASMLDQLSNLEGDTGFPPYNIERLGDNTYRISMAVAGFGDRDLNIEVKEGTLTIRGEKTGEDKAHQYIHQGIAARNFERRFRLLSTWKCPQLSWRTGFCTSTLSVNCLKR